MVTSTDTEVPHSPFAGNSPGGAMSVGNKPRRNTGWSCASVKVNSTAGMAKGMVAVLSDVTQLKEMDQMKTDLMSMVTHEIRTPLATVRGFAQILLKGGIAGDK